MFKNSFTSGLFTNLNKSITKAKTFASRKISSKTVKKRSTQFAFPAILILLALILSVQNYTPETYLSGWDTLHPEFDFKLNIERTFFGVFRTEQGLGAVASHAHMVELVRIFFLGLFDIFLPQNMIRYSYFFMCLIVGPLGMYYFLKNVFFKKKLPSFLGALFYLLNLGTYQVFAVPFEMFATLYAMIPWFFLTFDSVLRKSSRKNLFFFSLVVLLTSPAAYASSLWYLFFASVLVYFLPFVIFKRAIKGIFKRFTLAVSIIFLINAYWMLPNIYFALNNAKFVTDANLNKLFSGEAFLKNKEFGNISDILKLRSFYFDWGIYNFNTNQFEQITKAFSEHLAKPINQVLGFAFSAVLVFGFLVAIKRYKALSVSFILVILFSFIFLFNDNPPFSPIFNFLQEHMPLFKEALRFPHNKIHNVFIFFAALFFAVGIDSILIFAKKVFKVKVVSVLLAIIVSSALLYYMLPALKGNFISPHMRVAIPSEYFEMFDYLSTQKDGRAANLPVHSPWGWVFNNWNESGSNFQGAGFLYFGIKQSLLDRDFDRWNPLNEQYYLEMSNAVYSEDDSHLLEVIKKYDISYLLLDRSVINAGSDEKTLNHEATQKMLNRLAASGKIKFTQKEFGDFLTVYSFNQSKTFPVTALEKSVVSSAYSKNYYKDSIYSQFGDYALFDGISSFSFLSLINNESKVSQEMISIDSQNALVKTGTNNNSLNGFSSNAGLISSRIVGTKTDDGLYLLDIYPSTAKLDSSDIIAPFQARIFVGNDTLVAINEKVIHLENTLPNMARILDTVNLSSSYNTISTFNSGSITQNLYLTSTPMYFSFCGDGDNSRITSVISENSVVLEGPVTQDFCVTIPSYVFANTDSASSTLVNMSFIFNGNNKLSACLVKNGEEKCYHNIAISSTGNSKTMEFAIPYEMRTSSRLVIKVGESRDQKVEFENIEVKLYPSSTGNVIDNSFFQEVLPEKFSNVSLPINTDPSTYIQAQGVSNFKNECLKSNSKSTKKFYSDNLPFFEYKSNGDNYCDHYKFDSLSHSLSYIVVLKSQNSEGLPMSLCITNYSSRKCDIFAKLSNFKTPNTDIFYLPSTDNNGMGFDVNLENRSVKNTPSANRLYSIQFIPVPTGLLSEVKSGKIYNKFYEGKITGSKILSPSSFIIDTDNMPALLELSYAYHKGFNAYKIECEDGFECFIDTVFSPIFGKELKHGKGSSWNNVWEYLPTSNENEKVTILFLPQYLQYVGFGVLGLIFLCLILPKITYISIPFSALNEFFKKKSEYFKDKVNIQLNKHNVSASKLEKTKFDK